MIEIKEIKKNIWGIGEFYHFEKVISYLIIGKKQALLFDSGMGIYNMKEIIKNITNLPIIVINSHSHFDHIGGNCLFENIYIFNNKLIKEVSKNGINKNIIKDNYNNEKFFLKPNFFNLDNFNINGFKYKKILKNNDIIDLFPFKFKIIHTPGHSDDHICLYELNKKYLFSGDLIYDGTIYIKNLDKYLKSIKKISELKISYIFGGHNNFFSNTKKIKNIL